jgi:hypothetical protein
MFSCPFDEAAGCDRLHDERVEAEQRQRRVPDGRDLGFEIDGENVVVASARSPRLMQLR